MYPNDVATRYGSDIEPQGLAWVSLNFHVYYNV